MGHGKANQGEVKVSTLIDAAKAQDHNCKEGIGAISQNSAVGSFVYDDCSEQILPPIRRHRATNLTYLA